MSNSPTSADTTRPSLCTQVSTIKGDSATIVRSSTPAASATTNGRQQHPAATDSASPTIPRSYRNRPTRILGSKTGGPTPQHIGEDTPSSWLGRLWCGIRRRTDATSSSPSEGSSGTRSLPGAITECGGAAVGPIKDPHVVIPADIMFSPQRTALYASMVLMLVRNPYYLTRIVSHVKHHECDALLSIILDSLFGSPAYEPLLTVLFTEIVELEVDRTTSIDTVMRNDGPSVHMLSAYLKRHCCLEYLRIAVGPTIETMVALGSTSLDPELASVYQDWARSQTAMRLPLVASAVEAAGYTEVQNLSRRRQRHLVHVATHCLHDVINARHHIPAGLLAICASTMRATKRKFPEADLAKAYSLVGGIFFLRFVNAALTSPNQYGLLDASPTGTMKTNLKLLARLMQRLSNNSSKPADEWPVDARKFMKANVTRFHSFLASLTTGAGDAKIPPTAAVSQDGDSQQLLMYERISSGSDCSDSGQRRSSEGSIPKRSPGSWHSQRSDTGDSIGSAKDHTRLDAMAAFSPDQAKEIGNKDMPTVIHKGRDRKLPSMLNRPGLAIVSTNSTATASSSSNNANQLDKSSMKSTAIKTARPKPKNCRLLCNKDKDDDNKVVEGGNGSSSGSSISVSSPSIAADDSYSVKSMYDIGRQPTVGCDSTTQKRSSSSDCHAVVLPLNDLYLLQKYLAIYEDKWAPGEAKYIADKQAFGDGTRMQGLTPMAECLRVLGAVPTQNSISEIGECRADDGSSRPPALPVALLVAK
ncbi:RasGAP protein [Coemansia sp. BCRC 34301]|nr:RasGAP protein [Coemansia sp. BCRC 34301]